MGMCSVLAWPKADRGAVWVAVGTPSGSGAAVVGVCKRPRAGAGAGAGIAHAACAPTARAELSDVERRAARTDTYARAIARAPPDAAWKHFKPPGPNKGRRRPAHPACLSRGCVAPNVSCTPRAAPRNRPARARSLPHAQSRKKVDGRTGPAALGVGHPPSTHTRTRLLSHPAPPRLPLPCRPVWCTMCPMRTRTSSMLPSPTDGAMMGASASSSCPHPSTLGETGGRFRSYWERRCALLSLFFFLSFLSPCHACPCSLGSVSMRE